MFFLNQSIDPNFMMQPGFGMNPNIPGRPPCNCSQEIRRLENRVFSLEREVNRLRSRVTRLENNLPTMTPFDNNTNAGYNPNSYNLM